jgi:type III pantothenate kinase
MKLYTFDIGNSHPHIGIFEQAQLCEVLSFKEFSKRVPPESLSSACIAPCQVGVLPDGAEKYAQFFLKLPVRQEKSFQSMPVNYAATLGLDRLYEAYFTYQTMLNSAKRVVIIDAGTFITMDLVTSDGLQGGLITPGITAFLQSYRRGALLPELQTLAPHREGELPQNTMEAISFATRLYLKSSTEAFLEQTRPDLLVMTGGAAPFIEELIDWKGKILSRPHLIHESLAYLAQNN